jgi:alkanesulfonate monooxygenase
MRNMGRGIVDVFSTCPPSRGAAPEGYLRSVLEVARWSESYGCLGILVYTDNHLVDPWLVSQNILLATRSLAPLVAIQPVYMHPFAAAKMIATCAHLHGRRIFLNMLAGGFKNDLLSLGDPTPHDDRYVRMVEYTRIVQKLLESSEPVTFEGKYYRVESLTMSPAMNPELIPGILSSGSSEAGMETARAIGAIPVKYPKPPGEEEDMRASHPSGAGIRVGIIARENSGEAWRIARERFPEDRRGQLTHQLAMKVSDSVWHKQLSEQRPEREEDPYWLLPFHNYKTFCPYLVGNYTEVADLMRRYFSLGCTTVILDVPPHEEELAHIDAVFGLALDEGRRT